MRSCLRLCCSLPATLLAHPAPTAFAGSYVMMGIGRAGVLGGVWRAPPLALAEYSTALAEMLQVRAPGMKSELPPGTPPPFCACVRVLRLHVEALQCSPLTSSHKPPFTAWCMHMALSHYVTHCTHVAVRHMMQCPHTTSSHVTQFTHT